ncbi:MAG: DUF3349 domain-containing protein [Alphaproteobacteria bacterium]|nr:DUF3349 domain-containing protein [Alphaproteobacteria bacterium]MCB9694944.1 DUF3349 domain-containing protein [Alphaproteobacteria bacterium]MCB9697496.1 DUF3349 domain-containing protein [Alphaproteobacteria bacterium]
MIPEHLASTLHLLQRAFPRGIDEAEYRAVLEILYPFMADGNLAVVVAAFTGRDEGVVHNDAIGAQAGSAMAAAVRPVVQARLDAAGFDVWADEELG